MDNGRGMEQVQGREAGVGSVWGNLEQGVVQELKQGQSAPGELAREVIRQAEGELARDMTEVEKREEFVGVESAEQIAEREQEDQEDAKNEAGEGLSFENRIVAKNQESVARAVAPEVEKLTRQKSFRPSDLERLYRQEVNAMLAVFGRRIGDRN